MLVPRTRTTVIAVVALLVFSSATTAQTPAGSGSGLTLDAALSMAVASNPHLAAARLKKPVDVAGVGVAGERPNPDFSYELGRDTPRHNFTFTLPIELGGKRSRRIDLARATVTSGEAAFAQEVFTLQNEVRRAYFELAAAEARAVAAADLRGLAVRARDAAQARLSLGDAPRLELLQAELELAASDNDLTTATAASAANRAALNTLLGRDPNIPVTTADALTTRALPPTDVAMSRATAASVDLAAIDAEIAEQSARRALARAMKTPDFSAGAGVTSGVPDEFTAGWRATASVTLPLFATHQAGVVVEDAELTRLRAERAAIVADIAGHVTEARARAAAAEAQLDRYEKDILPRAIEVERMAEDSYRSGQSNLASLLQSLQSSREMRYRALEAGLDYQLALADVERAIGALIK
jgi:outer membrane protein, heavy metal efflux system